MIELKGSNGGTVEPMILHLAKGTIILESLLKMKYSKVTLYEDYKDSTNTKTKTKKSKITLGDLLNSKEFNNKYYSNNNPTRYSFSINDLNLISTESIFGNYSIMCNNFIIAAMIRNTSAHSINWKDSFIKDYEIMYSHIIYAIFFIIVTEYNL